AAPAGGRRRGASSSSSDDTDPRPGGPGGDSTGGRGQRVLQRAHVARIGGPDHPAAPTRDTAAAPRAGPVGAPGPCAAAVPSAASTRVRGDVVPAAPAH